MKIYKWSLLATSLLLLNLTIISCSSNDGGEPIDDGMNMTDDDGGTNLETAREETNTILTGNASKTWKIESALLRNDQGEFTITENFNVQDDEFVFSGDVGSGMLEWRPGNDINLGATDANGTLLDYYLAPENYSFSFTEESSDMLTSIDGQFAFTVVDDTTLTGTITFSGRSNAAGEELVLTLGEKTAEDYANPPSEGLVFTEIGSIQAFNQFGQQNNLGFIGSSRNNSLFIAHRDDCDVNNLRNRVIKFDLGTQQSIENKTDLEDFFTRKLNIVNNEVILTGGLNIYTYDLDLLSDPVVTPHNAGTLSRFSTAVVDNDVYVTGGDLNEVADKIRRIDRNTGTLEIVANLPSPKVHAGSEIVNNKLYVFSGRQEFFEDETVETTSYIYDLTEGTFQNFDTPVALYNTYASRFENLIFIAGDTRTNVDDKDVTNDDYDVWLGVYDTLTGEFTEIDHNLDDSDQFSYIQQMTVFNNKIYVLYGDVSRIDSNNNCAEFPWSIMVADL